MSRLLQTGLNAGDDPMIRIVGGEGAEFILDDGRRLVDGSNTGGPLGHQHPDMVDAIRRSASSPVINEGWFWTEREAAAEELISFAFAGEADWVGGVRFFLSGSEANDLALSLAQALTGRTALATRERAYHGMTGLARAMTVQPHWHGGLSIHSGGTLPVPIPVSVRKLPAPIGSTYGGERSNADLAQRLSAVDTILAGTAATIIDYSQGGIYYDSAYQDFVASAAKKAGSLWIADEVVTGLGRSGRWLAFHGGELRPDMVTLGKSLAGGAAPAGAVVFSKSLIDEMKDKSWQTYSTFRGHPSAIAAIRAYLRVVNREGLLERVQVLEARMKDSLIEIGKRHPSVSRIHGYGLHWTIELYGSNWRDWYADTAMSPIASRVAARAIEAGAVIATSGEPSSLFLAPPLIISDSQLDLLLTALDIGLTVSDEEL